MNKVIAELFKTLNLIRDKYDEAPESKVWSSDQLQISEPAVGGKVELINSDGSLSDAPDGQYTMEDGSSFNLKDGLITEYQAKEEDSAQKEEDDKKTGKSPVVTKDTATLESEEEEDMEEKPAEGSPAEEASETPAEEAKEDGDEDQELQDLKNRVATLEQTLGQLIDTINGVQSQSASKEDVNAFAKQLEVLNENLMKLSKVPVQLSKTTNSNKVKDAHQKQLDELNEFARILGGSK